MKITTLAQRPDLINDTVAMIERSFEYPMEEKYIIDFSPLFSKKNLENLHILTCNDELLAHIGLKKRKIKNKTIMFLGGIAVSQEHRGKGYLKKLLNYVIEKYAKKTDYFLLWSDLNSMYEKFNFTQVGLVTQTGNKNFKNDLNKFTKTKLSNLDSNKFEQVKRLYKNTYCDVERNDTDWEELKLIKSTDLYLKIQNNQIEEYFFTGKGADLTNIIHEHTKGITDQLKTFKLWTPPYSSNQSFKNYFLAMALDAKEKNKEDFFKDVYISGLDSI